MIINILSIFPDAIDNFLNESIIGRARKEKKVIINCYDIRAYANNKYKQVDDYLYGGGNGMLLMPEPIYNCYLDIIKDYDFKPLTILTSPRGILFNQSVAVEIKENHRVINIICGHYEGIDQRLIDEIVDIEISLGDYIVTGGEIGAIIISDCITRLCDGVLKNSESYIDESHYNGLLECDHYTRPFVWKNRKVPQVLISGHHKKIDDFRKKSSLFNTFIKRPDLFEKFKNNI